MMAMPVLNVALYANLSSAVYHLQLNNHNTFNLHLNLCNHRINKLLPGRLATDAVTVWKLQRLIWRKYGTFIFYKINIAILYNCAIDILIYYSCLYIKHTPEVPTVSLPPLMFSINNGDTRTREDLNQFIQYVNDIPTSLSDKRARNNPMPFTINVYTQKPMTYKHPYTLFVFQITAQYTCTRYANRKYCVFYVNLKFAAMDYDWDTEELFNMSINWIKLNVNENFAECDYAFQYL